MSFRISNTNEYDTLDNNEMILDNMSTNNIEDKTRLEEQNPNYGLNVNNATQRSLYKT